MKHKRVTRKRLLITSMGLVLIFLVWYSWMSSAFDEFDERVSQLRPGMTKADVIRIVGEPSTIDTAVNGTEIWAFSPPRGAFAEWPRCYFVAGDSIMSEFWWEPIHLTLSNEDVDAAQADN